jgi:nucleotide-binding universal stress UspA family protein
MNMLQLSTPPPARTPSAADRLFARVLLAIDFGPASLAAARWATMHVASRADAVLTHVVPYDVEASDEPTRHVGDDSVRQMTPAIGGGLGGFGATLDVASARHIVRVGRPSSRLASVANDTEASLLVLGRRAAANRIHVGEPNVIERVARQTSASVLVVPEGAARTPDHIVVAVDESPVTPLLLRIASRLARRHEIPLTVMHVLWPIAAAYDRIIRTTKELVGSAGTRERSDRLGRSDAEASLSQRKLRWLEALAGAHNVVGRDSTEVATGDPAREIARAAMQRDGALVVIGARGADAAPVGSIGSVARELLTRAPVPVLVVNAI